MDPILSLYDPTAQIEADEVAANTLMQQLWEDRQAMWDDLSRMPADLPTPDEIEDMCRGDVPF